MNPSRYISGRWFYWTFLVLLLLVTYSWDALPLGMRPTERIENTELAPAGAPEN